MLRFMCRTLVANDDPVVDPLDPPARNGIECRRSNRFAGAQAEAGVMPGATDGVANDETIGERPFVMGAVGADGKDVVPGLDDEHFLFTDSPANHAVGTEFSSGDSLCEIS
jgi:hypothetical protein